MRLWSEYCRRQQLEEHKRAKAVKLLWFRILNIDLKNKY